MVVVVHVSGIDRLRVFFFVFFYETVFLLASSYRAVPIACHFACFSLLCVLLVCSNKPQIKKYKKVKDAGFSQQRSYEQQPYVVYIFLLFFTSK